MNHFLLFIFLVFSYFLSSCSRAPIAEQNGSIDQMIDGWKEMVTAIQASSGNPDELRRKVFLLNVKLTGNWNIGISPNEAFEIRKDSVENSYKVTVTQPFRLFENRGGLTRMTYIQASLMKVGGIKGAVELGANVECIFRVKFFQENGLQVDFNRLKEAYNYEFVTDPPNSLKINSILADSVMFNRDYLGDEPISLRIKLDDRSSHEKYLSNEIIIPHCSRLQLRSKDELLIPRRAGQCIQHLKTIGNFFDKNTDTKMNIQETFANNCPLPVRCQLKAQYAYVQKKKVNFVEKKTYDFLVDPNSFETVDTSWDYSSQKHPFDSKLYKASTISKSSLPSGAPEDKEGDEEGNDYLDCQWERNR